MIEAMRGMLVAAGLVLVSALVGLALWLRPDATSETAGPAAATAHRSEPDRGLTQAVGSLAARAEATTTAERRAAPSAAAVEAGPETTLTGRVVDPLGRAIAGASVASCDAAGEDDGASARAESDAEGRFGLVFSAHAPPTHARFDAPDHLPRVVAIPANTPPAAWEVVLDARPIVAGLVRTTTSAPVPSPGTVEVDVRPTGSNEVLRFSAELTPEGSYLVRGLPTGELVRVWARAKGFDAQFEELSISLAANARHTHDFTLERGLVVKGVVLDEETEEPVPFAKVWGESLEPEPDSYYPTTTADALGKFRLEGFQRAQHTFDGMTLDTFQIVAASETHASSPLNAYALFPDENGEFEVELMLTRRSCAVRGVVFEPDGETPAAGALIWSIDAENNHTFEAADSEGAFEFTGLPAGSFAYAIYRTERGANGQYAALNGELELTRGDVGELRLVLDSDPRTGVGGRVLDPAGKPVVGREVRAAYQFNFGGLTIGLDETSTLTDAEGHYDFRGMRAGLHVLELDGCARPGSFELLLVSGQHREVDFFAGACMTVEGWVDARGRGLDDLELVLLDPASGHSVAQGELAADGTFRMSEVIEGSYELVLVHAGRYVDRVPVTAAQPTGIALALPE